MKIIAAEISVDCWDLILQIFSRAEGGIYFLILRHLHQSQNKPISILDLEKMKHPSCKNRDVQSLLPQINHVLEGTPIPYRIGMSTYTLRKKRVMKERAGTVCLYRPTKKTRIKIPNFEQDPIQDNVLSNYLNSYLGGNIKSLVIFGEIFEDYFHLETEFTIVLPLIEKWIMEYYQGAKYMIQIDETDEGDLAFIAQSEFEELAISCHLYDANEMRVVIETLPPRRKQTII